MKLHPITLAREANTVLRSMIRSGGYITAPPPPPCIPLGAPTDQITAGAALHPDDFDLSLAEFSEKFIVPCMAHLYDQLPDKSNYPTNPIYRRTRWSYQPVSWALGLTFGRASIFAASWPR